MRSRRFAIRIAILWACGCGDDAASGGSADKVSELTVEELRALCAWSYDLTTQHAVTIGELCTLEAVLETEDTSQCGGYRNDCLADYAQSPRDYTQDKAECATLTVASFASCNVTVAVLKRCFTDAVASYTSAARTASCEARDALGSDEDPASCEDVPPSCDELAGLGIDVKP